MPLELEDKIKQTGLGLGFDKVSISKAVCYPEHEALKDWLALGFHGSMSYLERGASKRMNPKEIFPEAKSVITCALNYNTDHPYSTDCKNSGRGWIARYAWGEDYHLVMGKMLKEFVDKIVHMLPVNICKVYVDTGPVMERVFAKNSGIGWMGKNTCIIDKKLGSWLFLGVILTDLELKEDPIVSDHCGKCTACIDACPTQAIIISEQREREGEAPTALPLEGATRAPITPPYKIDARKCISYLTIEHRGEIESGLVQKMGNHIFGCDICQDVCPWNRQAPSTNLSPFQPRDDFFNPSLEKFGEKVKKEYPTGFKNSPLKRAKREGLLRNIRIAKHEKP